MLTNKTQIFAIGLSTLVLLAAANITGAAPNQKSKKASAKALAAPTKAQIEAGRKIYDAGGCGACHLVGDKGGKTGPELTHIGADKKWSAARLAQVVRDPKKVLQTAKMPAYGTDKISDKDLKTLVAYVGSLK